MNETTSRIGASIFAIALALGVSSGVASANDEPVGDCPSGTTSDGPDPEANGWTLTEIGGTIPEDVGNKRDQNGDGYVCQRFTYGLRLKYGDYDSPPQPVLGDCCGYWAVKDNTTPLP